MRDSPTAFANSALALAIAVSLFDVASPRPAHAFAGFGPEDCADLVATPKRFWRLRAGSITYRISNNFKARYPDTFSQYLVTDVARLWEDYISSGFQWRDDIYDRFSYYRKDPSQSVYELKSVLLHEFGHAVGMQHSDACFYNTNSATNMPWMANHRSAGGGLLEVQPTVGPELMNEIWTESSPGMKAPMALGIDGYNRSPGVDGWEFVKHAYPFQSLSFDQIGSGTPLILVDSTDAGSSGGQTSYPGDATPVDPDDPNQGAFFDGINIWIGNDIGYKSRYESWNIQNNTGSDITQVTLRVAGSGTRRAIFESAPGVFTDFGVGVTSSPEVLRYAWTAAPFIDLWQAGSSGWFSLRLDVHDWVVQEALMWYFSNEAWPIPLPGIVPEVPWGFTTPDTPPPGTGPGYIAVSPNPEPSIEPTDIELLPPATPGPGTGIRALKLLLPDTPGVVIERLQLLPLDWTQAEMLARDDSERRSTQLMRAFTTRRAEVVDLLPDRTDAEGREPADVGLLPDKALFAATGKDSSRGRAAPLSGRFPVPFASEVTYAALVTASTADVRVTLVSLPEMTDYLGTRAARCALADDASSCCPYGADVTEGTHLRDRLITGHGTRCLLAKAGDDTVLAIGEQPQIVATGDGADQVYGWAPGLLVTLGRGDDGFFAGPGAAARVVAGIGKDRIFASALADTIDGGEGPDRILAHGGDDLVIAGPGDDRVWGGPGNDEIHPGSGSDKVFAGRGDDRVVVSHNCELGSPKLLVGGPGQDTLVLPTSAAEARARGLSFKGFERIVEDVTRASRISDCE